jgi:hypothetical protein
MQDVQKSPWLNAWNDPVAGICSLTQLMTFADLNDGGQYMLLTADHR